MSTYVCIFLFVSVAVDSVSILTSASQSHVLWNSWQRGAGFGGNGYIGMLHTYKYIVLHLLDTVHFVS